MPTGMMRRCAGLCGFAALAVALSAGFAAPRVREAGREARAAVSGERLTTERGSVVVERIAYRPKSDAFCDVVLLSPENGESRATLRAAEAASVGLDRGWLYARFTDRKEIDADVASPAIRLDRVGGGAQGAFGVGVAGGARIEVLVVRDADTGGAYVMLMGGGDGAEAWIGTEKRSISLPWAEHGDVYLEASVDERRNAVQFAKRRFEDGAEATRIRDEIRRRLRDGDKAFWTPGRKPSR